MNKDGGSAFPVGSHGMDYVEGMTLRDWFAGMAMQGMMANEEYIRYLFRENAIHAYEMADAMLAEREK